MKKGLRGLLLPALLLLATACQDPVSQGGDTIWWQQDSEGYIRFRTSDPQHCGYSFVYWDGPYLSPLGSFQARVEKSSGNPWGAFGIVFCLQDLQNFYLAAIDIRGFYSVHKQVAGSWSAIVDWTHSELLRPGYGSPNQITVSRAGSTGGFRLTLNENPICFFADASLSGGYCGAFADVLPPAYEEFPGEPVDVRFKLSRLPLIAVDPESGLITTEAGGQAGFSLALNSEPQAEVTVALFSNDATEGMVSPASLTFSPGNWSSPQNVLVTGVDDLLDDGEVSYRIVTAPAASADPAWNGVDAADVTLTNADDDPPAAPTGLQATAAAFDRIELSWTDASANEEGFRIERKLGAGGLFGAVATTPAGVTTFSDAGVSLVANALYHYRVAAFNAAGTGDFSEQACAVRKITVPDGSSGDYFGGTVALGGDYAIVGARYDSSAGYNAGAAYIYHRESPGVWDAGTRILAPDAGNNALFGGSVALSGDYAVVGGRKAAYVFRRTGVNTWDAGTKLLSPNPASAQSFGFKADISGDYIIVGDYEEDVWGLYNAGAAYIFHRTGENAWDSGTRVASPDTHPGGSFGRDVAIDGDYAIANSWRNRYAEAYVFHRTGLSSWDAGTRIYAAGGVEAELYCPVAISGDYALVGAGFEEAAYVFHRMGPNSWGKGTWLTAPPSQAGAGFGASVSIDGDYAMIGPGYVFRRTGGNAWDEGVRFLPPAALSGDGVGGSVSVAGDFCLLGADGDDEKGTNAGAAYLHY